MTAAARAAAFAERIFNAAIEVVDLTTVYLGDKLGSCRALAAAGDETPAR